MSTLEPSDIVIRGVYWVDQSHLKRFLKVTGLYPNTIRWIPLKVIVVTQPSFSTSYNDTTVFVTFLRYSDRRSKIQVSIPLNSLVRRYNNDE